jgi:hypothetical protein
MGQKHLAFARRHCQLAGTSPQSWTQEMAELKTKPTKASVTAFIKSMADKQTQKDCRDLVKLMKAATGASPKMWGESIVGFGNCHLKYASGRELDWFYVGFSPRKAALTLYLSCDLSQHSRLLKKLGKHKIGKGCLIKRLADVDQEVLAELVRDSVQELRDRLKLMD